MHANSLRLDPHLSIAEFSVAFLARNLLLNQSCWSLYISLGISGSSSGDKAKKKILCLKAAARI